MVWCGVVLTLMKILDRFVPEENVVSSDHPVFGGTMKPESSVYDCFGDFVRSTRRDDNTHIVYLDDSIKNLVPLLDRPEWIPVHVDPHPMPPHVFTCAVMKQVSTVFEAADLLVESKPTYQMPVPMPLRY